jgi:hypothetical protein
VSDAKFHPNSIGSKVAPPQKFKRQPYWSDQLHFQCHHFRTKFHPNSPFRSEVIKGFIYTQLRSLNARHFGMAAPTTLKDAASRSSSMASPAYKIS